MTAQIHNILFIFREYNDLDHMTPIMYQTLAEPDFNPTIVCMNENFDIKNDFRIQFLKNQFPINLFQKPILLDLVLKLWNLEIIHLRWLNYLHSELIELRF